MTPKKILTFPFFVNQTIYLTKLVQQIDARKTPLEAGNPHPAVKNCLTNKMRELRAYLPEASKGGMDSSRGLKSDFCIGRRVPIKDTYPIILDRQNKHKRFGNQVFLSIFPTNDKWCFLLWILLLFVDIFCN